MEYRQFLKESVIPKGNDAIIDDFWNVYTIQKVPDPNLNEKTKKNQRG